jgi:NAD-dependent DNA ligase
MKAGSSKAPSAWSVITRRSPRGRDELPFDIDGVVYKLDDRELQDTTRLQVT